MAQFEKYAAKLLLLEGSYTNDPVDRGGATNRGVTIDTWRQAGYDKDDDGDIDREDVRLLSVEDCMNLLRYNYWDRWRGDEIRDQQVAAMVVDWLWCSGKWGIVIPQRLLGVKADGIAGPETLGRLNREDPGQFLVKVYNARIAFIRNIIRNDPSQKRFERGWMNRVNAFV